MIVVCTSDRTFARSHAPTIQPASRGDQRMLTDLIVMVSHATAGGRASDAVAEIYGIEALPALDRAVAVSMIEPRAHARLRALRDRLAASAQQ